MHNHNAIDPLDQRIRHRVPVAVRVVQLGGEVCRRSPGPGDAQREQQRADGEGADGGGAGFRGVARERASRNSAMPVAAMVARPRLPRMIQGSIGGGRGLSRRR